MRSGESKLVGGRSVAFICARAEGGFFLVVSLPYLSRRALAALRLDSREFKELEIVVLRHELAVFAATSPVRAWTLERPDVPRLGQPDSERRELASYANRSITTTDTGPTERSS